MTRITNPPQENINNISVRGGHAEHLRSTEKPVADGAPPRTLLEELIEPLKPIPGRGLAALVQSHLSALCPSGCRPFGPRTVDASAIGPAGIELSGLWA